MHSPEDGKNAKLTKLIRIGGWSLIAIAIAVPQIQVYLAGEGPVQVGGELAGSLGRLSVTALVVWMVTRKKLERTKAIGTFCVGAAVLISSLAIAMDKAATTETAKEILESSLKIQAENAAKLGKVMMDISAIDMSKVLTVDAVGDKKQRTLSKTQLAQFKALLTERRSTVSSSQSRVESLFSTLPPDSDTRRGGLEGLENSKRNNKELFGDLDAVQLSYAESLEALFNWADTQDGKMQLNKGQIMFADQASVLQYQALIEKIELQENLYNKVVETYNVKLQQQQARDAEMKRQAATLLAK